MPTLSAVEGTYRFIILSPILLVESRAMLSPRDSSLFMSLLAESRRDGCLSVVGVLLLDACWTWTTGMGASRFARDSAFACAMLGG